MGAPSSTSFEIEIYLVCMIQNGEIFRLNEVPYAAAFGDDFILITNRDQLMHSNIFDE